MKRHITKCIVLLMCLLFTPSVYADKICDRIKGVSAACYIAAETEGSDCDKLVDSMKKFLIKKKKTKAIKDVLALCMVSCQTQKDGVTRKQFFQELKQLDDMCKQEKKRLEKC